MVQTLRVFVNVNMWLRHVLMLIQHYLSDSGLYFYCFHASKILSELYAISLLLTAKLSRKVVTCYHSKQIFESMRLTY